MKQTISLLIVGLLIVGSVSTLVGQDEAGVPVVMIPKMRHDFGKVFERDLYEYAFVIRNRGTADLEIKEVKPG